MPRQKEYQRDVVLEKAMNLFWKKGFVGTSMSSLVEAMQLNTYSLYSEFGSKLGLFRQTLRHYWGKVMVHVIRPLESPENGLASIEAASQGILRILKKDNANGCFVINSACEAANLDLACTGDLQEYRSELTEKIHACLKRAKALNEISEDWDTEELAEFFTLGFQSIFVASQTMKEQLCLETMIQIYLNVARGQTPQPAGSL